MSKELAKIKYYVVVALLALGGFVWAGLTGTRLLGDDNESIENKQGYYGGSGHSGGSRGYSRFYHK
ncbi:hypothetical protein EXU85_10380 [Spirosoma sp. KCTC 42546]|uniref:hypothetical protein n=1 Tax=Spirosoma sp. KCTC 42546 TaxID=2520506 RepID=UPI00115A50D7|nr:hypothetical protein [Spirosoma sp. KCTC 42546]QDK78991.1 hypothetical protein EXU85_10380 [Spirosoma sp. KCTC 42546]